MGVQVFIVLQVLNGKLDAISEKEVSFIMNLRLNFMTAMPELHRNNVKIQMITTRSDFLKQFEALRRLKN